MVRAACRPGYCGVIMRQRTSAGVACFFNFILVLGVTTAFGPFAPADDRPSQRRDDLVAVVERVKGAVVNIHSERVNNTSDDPLRIGIMQPQRVNGMGTGIVLDPRGYIVTNYHVVDDVQALRVRLIDGTNCLARVIALDKENLRAVLDVLPALKNPTISQLSDDAWVAVNTILEELTVRNIIPRLKEAGAQGIVEYPLNKIVM